MGNRLFFPQGCLDPWLIDGRIELTATELILLADARRYAITEGVRVLAEVTGAADPHGIVGKVRAKSELESIGAEILEGSMVIGENAYDVVAGWAGAPTTPLEAHLASPAYKLAQKRSGASGPAPSTDEELVARFARGTP